ncbi:MAG: trypsin-like peptidase domain-containing protein [Brevundimonas sp.]|uniref:trypsin-like peptidase domain-containing protein n=1 Tax=Brevundimonas sp. TaxID=1871086 RepID=UPI0018514769|nr:trypsin-like peptidase domain-containing protein [Brevundimonas sp.]MBA4805672.1 trypsin-like peptidase domain-containing protein [Brevundimonas sp.]
MMKRKEFMLGAVAGLAFAAAATAGGVIDWPSAQAGPVAGVSGRLAPSAGAAGLAFAPPQGAPLSFADIFQQVAPAVVQIDVRTPVETPRSLQIPGLPGFSIPVPEGEAPQGEDGEEGATALGAGSGFFISADGFIVTNNHVIENATEITVRLADERELEARVIGRDPATDLAVIKVEGADFPFVSFEEAAQPRVGDWVIAVGNPFGLGGTATAGIVSAVSRRNIDPSTANYVDFLQIDAAINRGNSGGPTFDIYGRVIGVNSAIYGNPLGGSVGIGFAIPSVVAKPVVEELMREGRIERGYIGATVGLITPEIQRSLQLPNRRGALIVSVNPGGPSDTAGLRAGDIVLSLNGREVENNTDLTRRVGQADPGDNLRMDILRDGRRQTVTVRSGRRPSEEELVAAANGSGGEGPAPAPEATGVEVGGVTVAPLTAAARSRFDIPREVNGIVVTAPGRGSARGFRPGYVIMRAGNRQVTSVADLQAEVEAARRGDRGVFLLVWTPQGNVPFVLELPDPE